MVKKHRDSKSYKAKMSNMKDAIDKLQKGKTLAAVEPDDPDEFSDLYSEGICILCTKCKSAENVGLDSNDKYICNECGGRDMAMMPANTPTQILEFMCDTVETAKEANQE